MTGRRLIPFLGPDLARAPAVLAARDALQQVLEAHGPDAALRTAAGALTKPLKNLYIKRYRVKLAGGHACCLRLIGKRCGSRGNALDACTPPGCDHFDLWNRGGRAVRFTMQPYGLSMKTAGELTAWCEALGLEWHLDAQGSWYFPGSSILLEIATRSEFRGEWR